VAPDTSGEYLFFKTIQTCTGGVETAWVEEYTGEGEEPEHPSPVVLLVEATGDHHGEEETTETTAAEEEATETTEATDTTEVAAEPVSDSDDDSDTLAIVALVVGALGLGFGGAAFARSRKA
jgi:hypothetical protein